MPNSPYMLRWPRLASPRLRNGGRFPMLARNPGLVYDSPGTVALHLHDYSGRMWLGGRLLRLQPGDFTLTPARMPSNYDLDQAGFHWCVHFEAMPAGRHPIEVPLHWRPGAHRHRISERLQEIIHLHRLGEAGGAAGETARQASNTALQGFLLWIAVTVGSQARRASAPTRVDAAPDEARRRLDEHDAGPVNVPALAKQLGVSQNFLARRFRAKHGMTLQRYLLTRRIDVARHLLAVTRLPLKAVAIEAGLGNPQYFHRQFKQVTGHSPSDERRADF